MLQESPAQAHRMWVVLPAYNEEGSIAPLLDDLLRELGSGDADFAILVVNDGSTDQTAAIVRGYESTRRVTLLDQPVNRGLAETLRTGLLAAVRQAQPDDIVIVMDADNTHPAGLVFRMARLIREGNDVVIASRYRHGSHVRGLALYRKALSNGASWLFRAVFPTAGVRDYTCGYRAYRAGMLMQLVEKHGQEFISERGFACMVDILLRLREQGAIFTEVPLVLRYDRKEGQSKMKVLATVKETLLLLFRRRFGR
ncbi:MAG TPA: glycosyltransferase family 2 protein [Thermoanaerobaculia bacterium]|jgi:dolichol-phosphate mannosyltransferase|nr:glycosyltransferase family 2 protein [Thermoanaerobaculia bacterium]